MTAYLVSTGDNSFDITYTVDGVTIRKAIQRITFAQNQLGGSYYGGLAGTAKNCVPASLNGYVTTMANGVMTISHIGSNLKISGGFEDSRGWAGYCDFTATYTQSGRMGAAKGNYHCYSVTTNETGTFEISRLEATANGILATMTSQSNICSFSGRFGAIRQ